jgi:hypothetical protein
VFLELILIAAVILVFHVSPWLFIPPGGAFLVPHLIVTTRPKPSVWPGVKVLDANMDALPLAPDALLLTPETFMETGTSRFIRIAT